MGDVLTEAEFLASLERDHIYTPSIPGYDRHPIQCALIRRGPKRVLVEFQAGDSTIQRWVSPKNVKKEER